PDKRSAAGFAASFRRRFAAVPRPGNAGAGFPPYPAAGDAIFRDDAATDPAASPCRWGRSWRLRERRSPGSALPWWGGPGTTPRGGTWCAYPPAPSETAPESPQWADRQNAAVGLPPTLPTLPECCPTAPLQTAGCQRGGVARNSSGRPNPWPLRRPTPVRMGMG